MIELQSDVPVSLFSDLKFKRYLLGSSGVNRKPPNTFIFSSCQFVSSRVVSSSCARLNWFDDRTSINREPKARCRDSVFLMIQAS